MVGDEVTFDGTPLCATYNLILAHFEEEPPEPKTEVVEIPFGSDIDITDAFGALAYSNRTQTFEFLAFCGASEFRALMSKIMALVHGRRATYTMTLDPEYTYAGRWQVTEYDFTSRHFGTFTVEVDVDPWKIKADREYTFNAYPAITKVFESGVKPVMPTVTTQQDVYVTFKGKTETFSEGTHQSTNLTFTAGDNSVRFECSEWYFYQYGTTLVVNDDYISFDEDTGVLTLDDEIIEGFDEPVLTLDNDFQFVTVRYTWRDL